VSVRRLFIGAQAEEKCGEYMSLSMEPRAATAGDLEEIKGFLRRNGLPDLGVDEWVENFFIIEDEDGRWVGVAGLEVYGESGLLRSVAVDWESRKKGHGRKLVSVVVEAARSRGIRRLYLLTDDASSYFEGRGFQVVDRNDVDEVVKTSLEFTEACPESATVMRKVIH
jgi:N-acetylglutamate synthase-like GNAT family acetyltransferase